MKQHIVTVMNGDENFAKDAETMSRPWRPIVRS